MAAQSNWSLGRGNSVFLRGIHFSSVSHLDIWPLIGLSSATTHLIFKSTTPHWCNNSPDAPRAGSARTFGIPFQKRCSLSKTTKLILLDSLLQEVCINSWRRWVARLRVRSGWVSILVSHKPSLFRTKESPLIPDQMYPSSRSLNVLSTYAPVLQVASRSSPSTCPERPADAA